VYEEYAAKIKDLVSSDEQAASFVEARQEVNQENKQIREENQQVRQDYTKNRAKLVTKYKQTFAKVLVQKLPKLTEEKLSKVNEKITTMINTFETNTKISDDKKDKIISQLSSLQELIDEELENRDVVNEDIDLDAIFAD
jgi:uncharacterized coiled-coil DUF342 family protein